MLISIDTVHFFFETGHVYTRKVQQEHIIAHHVKIKTHLPILNQLFYDTPVCFSKSRKRQFFCHNSNLENKEKIKENETKNMTMRV